VAKVNRKLIMAGILLVLVVILFASLCAMQAAELGIVPAILGLVGGAVFVTDIAASLYIMICWDDVWDCVKRPSDA
jgi:hypothetical protein